MIIDFHTHCFPDQLAEKVIRQLGEEGGMPAYADGTRGGLIESMRRAGIDFALNLPIATIPEQVDSINRWAAGQNRAPVFSFGTIHPASPEPAEILRGVRDSGLRGIKLHPEYQNFSPDERRLDAIWESCIELDLFLLFHAGFDIAFKAPFRSEPAKFAELHRRFPELRMILAHGGDLQDWQSAIDNFAGKRIYLDLSFTFAMIPPEGIVQLIRAVGAEYILFGSDSPWRDQSEDLRKFLSLPLSEEEREHILWRNASGILGLS